MEASVLPIRPGKLRLDAVTHTSLGPYPFMGTETGPTARGGKGGAGLDQGLDIAQLHEFQQHFLGGRDNYQAGFGMNLFPARILAAAAMSSTRPPVQVPMKTWSTSTSGASLMGTTRSTLWGRATWGSSWEISKV